MLSKITCPSPDACVQQFNRILEDQEKLAAKIEEFNTKMFSNNGEAYATRLVVIENWIDNVKQSNDFMKKWMYGILAAIALQIALGLWNRLDLVTYMKELSPIAAKIQVLNPPSNQAAQDN